MTRLELEKLEINLKYQVNNILEMTASELFEDTNVNEIVFIEDDVLYFSTDSFSGEIRSYLNYFDNNNELQKYEHENEYFYFEDLEISIKNDVFDAAVDLQLFSESFKIYCRAMFIETEDAKDEYMSLPSEDELRDEENNDYSNTRF